jgi:PAS domain S-box-containing protein
MADAPHSRKKKAAPDAAAELPQELSTAELRRQAEDRLDGLSAAASAAAAAAAPEELTAAVHELRVHQIELEMQNEELRRAQLDLEEQRTRYFELFHLAPVGYVALSERGIVGEANHTASLLLGVEHGLLVGQPFSAFVFAADRKAYYRHLELLAQTEEAQACELRLQPVGAEQWWARLSSRPRRPAGGEPLRYHLTFTDVDDRVRAEEALREREEQLASAVEGSGVGLWDWRPQTGEETFNARWAEILGYTLDELAPTSIATWRDLFHPDDLRRADQLLEEHFAGQSDLYECEARMRHKDGHWVWVLERGKVAEWDGDGRPLRMVGTQLDVSERRRAEEALREASLYARTLIETSLDPLVTISAEGRITDVNAATETITGRSREQLLGSDFADYFTAPQMARAGYLQAFAAGQVIDYPLAIRHASGTITEVLYNASVYRDEQGEVLGVFAAARDVTERQRAEDELRESEQNFRTFFDTVDDIIVVATPEGRLVYATRARRRAWVAAPTSSPGWGWSTCTRRRSATKPQRSSPRSGEARSVAPCPYSRRLGRSCRWRRACGSARGTGPSASSPSPRTSPGSRRRCTSSSACSTAARRSWR